MTGVPAAWVPRASDEFPHRPEGDPAMPWKETWFVGAYDLTNGFALSLHMTVSPERPDDTRVAVAVRLGAREGLGVRIEAGCSDHDAFGNGLAQLRVVNSSWNSDHELRLVGEVDDCSFDLVLSGNHWATSWDRMPAGFPDAATTVARWQELTGLTARNLDYFEVYAAVRLAVAMVRAAKMMIANGQLPPDAPMALTNPAVQLLNAILGMSATALETQTFIGNR